MTRIPGRKDDGRDQPGFIERLRTTTVAERNGKAGVEIRESTRLTLCAGKIVTLQGEDAAITLHRSHNLGSSDTVYLDREEATMLLDFLNHEWAPLVCRLQTAEGNPNA